MHNFNLKSSTFIQPKILDQFNRSDNYYTVMIIMFLRLLEKSSKLLSSRRCNYIQFSMVSDFDADFELISGLSCFAYEKYRFFRKPQMTSCFRILRSWFCDSGSMSSCSVVTLHLKHRLQMLKFSCELSWNSTVNFPTRNTMFVLPYAHVVQAIGLLVSWLIHHRLNRGLSRCSTPCWVAEHFSSHFLSV